MVDETPLANAPEARTETGEIKDVALKPEVTETEKATETTEKKPESTEAKPVEKAKPADAKAAPGAPAQYEAFKVPEGFTLDEKVVAEAAPLFKEMGLNQAQAQSLVDFYGKQLQAQGDAPRQAWNDLQTDWQTKLKADPEIGGKLPEVKQTVSRALDSLGDPALAQSFREAMDLTGVGNNPAFAKVFYKLSQQVMEGKPVSGRGPSPLGQQAPGASERPSPAAALYPKLS